MMPALRVRLFLLVASAILPLAILTLTTNYYLSKAYDDVASTRLLLLSRSVLSTVEARIASVETAEEVLAVSDTLQENNLGEFARTAKAYLDSALPSENFVLSDTNETQLVNTAAPNPLEKRTNTNPAILDAHREVMRTGKTAVSRLIHGQVIQQFAIGVETPVIHDGHITYILGMPVTSKELSDLLAQQHFDSQWTIAIWDREGRVVGRSPAGEEYLGREATPNVYSEIVKQQDRVITTTTFEGREVSTAIAHSASTGLALGLGVPEEVVTAPRLRALYATMTFSLLFLVGSGFAATRLATNLLGAEHTRDLLFHELNHRIGNLLATLQAIAEQTFRSARSKEEAGESLQNRIMALARVNRLLTDEDWKRTALLTVIRNALEPYSGSANRITIIGDEATLVSPKVAQALTLAINELATNALKHGALSVSSGQIKIEETREDSGTIAVSWKEEGGPPVQPPKREGFGSALLRGLAVEFRREVTIKYTLTGVVCIIRVVEI